MRFLLLVLLLGAGSVLPASPSPLLVRAAEKWLAERDHWAFTLQVREYEGGKLTEERVERYDPSKPVAERWELVSVDGGAAKPDRLAKWLKLKLRSSRKEHKSLAEYVDFDRATVIDHTALLIRYRLPMRSASELLFPVDRVELKVTVNRATSAIEKVEAGIDEPYKVALGLGRILDVDLEMWMNPGPIVGTPGDPAVAKPDGTAHFVVDRLGKRIEYDLSDFKRVLTAGEGAAGEK